ncbi:FAM188A [Bugula neritina]|uniref:FAM188A n=1 Tax=Bugula neritina TaxID=10212 RepID=A0A7J7J8F4_BUGNE|nr:FAM188A [Bugula neritina]
MTMMNPRTFYLYHYNGIKRSNNSNKIEYHRAKATLRDFLEPTVITDSSSILKCLQTKWPTIELQWDNEIVPSVN